jgi:hypothetical protein
MAIETAAIISVFSLIVAILSFVISAKNYEKSKRLEFFQRRDQLFVKIADLNAKNSETHLISARHEIVAIKRASLVLDGEHAERNKTGIAAIKELQEKMELAAKGWDENIKQLHSICSSLTPESDVTRIEGLIAAVQVASDDAKKHNEVLLSSLHILESTEPILRTSAAEMQRLQVRRAELNLEKAIEEFRSTQP